MAETIINSGSGSYLGRKFDVQLSAELTHSGFNVFLRDFNGQDAGIVSSTKNTVLIPNHFFVTGEKITYRYYKSDFNDSTRAVGIGTTDIPGIGLTDKLPKTVYAVKINDSEIKLAGTLEKSLKRIPETLNLYAAKKVIGNDYHTFIGEKQNTRSLLTIDNLIQSPVISTAITCHLVSDLSGAADLAIVSGITSFFAGDLIKINNEIMKINYLGFGGGNALILRRPMLGSSIQGHKIGDVVTKLKGDFNIVDTTVYFPSPPFGRSPVTDLENPNPMERDYVGLETFSTFSGRVFLRSGYVDTNISPYKENYIFDDISTQFVGITTYAVLTSDNQNISGFSTGNGVVLINNVFQTPDFFDYGLNESSGITTIYFTGYKNRNNIDVNTASIPRGGIILSIASTEGFGYQPRISAGGTSVVSYAGTIQSISIGNTGSGYRSAKTYQYEAKISELIPNNSTIIPIKDTDGLFYSLNSLWTGNNIEIEVSNKINKCSIVGLGTTNVTIPALSAPLNNINEDETVVLTVNSPPFGLANIYVQNDPEVGIQTLTHIGVSSIKDGHIIGHKITNVGSGFTNYVTVNEYTTNLVSLPGYTEIFLNKLTGITTSNYISVGTAVTNAKVVGVGSTAVEIGSPLTGLIAIDTQAEIKIYDPLKLIFDDPLAYNDLWLQYSNDSPSGIGTYAKINVVVGQGSSVIDFEMTNYGYSYGQGEILTVPTGGLTGIPTDPSLGSNFKEFQIIVDKTFTDDFSGWTFGDLTVFDSIDRFFTGRRKTFPLRQGGKQITIKKRSGSPLELEYNLLVFLNDIYQVPNNSYSFNGGSFITFSEPPQRGDKCIIVFYSGTTEVDTQKVDILETIKVGDEVTLNDSNIRYQEDSRTVTEIRSTDDISTNVYPGPGISLDSTYNRSITWCKQRVDKIIEGNYVGKDRTPIEPLIYPKTKIIQSVGIGSTEIIFVENLKTFFDSNNEYEDVGIIKKPQKSIIIISNDSLGIATATAVVDYNGKISSIVVNNGGVGYSTTPDVSIAKMPTDPGIGIGTDTGNISGIVTSYNSAYWTFDGDITGNNPSFYITVGSTLTLNISSLTDVFYIQTTPGIFLPNKVVTTNIQNNGTKQGFLVWTPLTEGRYYYVSLTHPNMAGVIDVIPKKRIVDYNVRATAKANISNGSVSSIDVVNSGVGYTNSNPPLVLISPPGIYHEKINQVSYEGDFGWIVGVKTTSIPGIAKTGLVLDFFIPKESFLLDTDIVSSKVEISGIQTGYYFVANNTNIGTGLISLRADNTVVSYGSSFIDNVYQASKVSIAQTFVVGYGVTDVTRVVVSLADYNGLGNISTYGYYSGEFSWGRIYDLRRSYPKTFKFYDVQNEGLSGIQTSPDVIRINPLKYLNYTGINRNLL